MTQMMAYDTAKQNARVISTAAIWPTSRCQSPEPMSPPRSA